MVTLKLQGGENGLSSFDLIIHNGCSFYGTRNPSYHGDIGIKRACCLTIDLRGGLHRKDVVFSPAFDFLL